MAYCDKQDIIDEYKGLAISTGSGFSITDAIIDDWINEESAYIDGRIVNRYILPITEALYPAAFLILKRICIFRVTERVKNKLEVKTNATQLSTEQKYTENYVRTPNNDMTDIAKGTLILIDVPIENSGGVSTYCDSTDHTNPVFKVGKQQW